MKRIRDVAGRTTLVTAAFVIGLSGCSTLSPSVITETYPASDGTQLDLPGSDVGLRNFLVIGAEKGEPAQVIGAVANDGATEVQVRLQATLGETAQPTQTVVTVGAHTSVLIGPGKDFEMEIPELPVEPGAFTELSAATATGGQANLNVPVLPPQGEYADITPAPSSPSPTTTKKPKASATEDDTPDASATDQPSVAPAPKTAEPTETDS